MVRCDCGKPATVVLRPLKKVYVNGKPTGEEEPDTNLYTLVCKGCAGILSGKRRGKS